MGIADGPLLNDVLQQVDALLEFGSALSDGFVVVLNGGNLLGVGAYVRFAGRQHFGVYIGVLSVTDALEQDGLLVTLALFQQTGELCESAFDVPALTRPPPYILFNGSVVLLGRILDE